MAPQHLTSGRVVAGWAGVLAAPFGLLGVVGFMMAVDGDTAGMLQPAIALVKPAQTQAMFVAGMVADALGYYVLPLLMCGFLSACLPAQYAGRVAMARFCLALYAVFGISGALILMASLSPLSTLYASGAGAAAGAAAAWSGIAHSVQNGLWWFEMLPFGLFAFLLGPALRVEGYGHGRVLMAAGSFALLYWLSAMPGLSAIVPAAGKVAELATFGTLSAILVWFLLAGRALLRSPR